MVHVANDSKKLLFIFEMTQDEYRKAAIEADTGNPKDASVEDLKDLFRKIM